MMIFPRAVLGLVRVSHGNPPLSHLRRNHAVPCRMHLECWLTSGKLPGSTDVANNQQRVYLVPTPRVL
jgi:hypothetical protein